MENQIFTGIGCFAKPERLGRVFKKLVQNYTLGPFKGNQLNEHIIDKNEGVELLQALMEVLAKGYNTGECETSSFKESKTITGFYLTVNDQKLILAIFAKGKRTKSEIFSTSLDELTKLRQKRLN